MGNLFKAHIFKERTRGEREEVKLKLFNLDDSPFELPEAEPPGPPVVEGWNIVANADMQNSWTSLGSNYSVRFRKRPDNTVELRGYAKPGVKGLMFYLPPGYRPTNNGLMTLTFMIPGYDTGAQDFPECVVSIGADGAVAAAFVDPDAYYMHLSSIRFTTD